MGALDRLKEAADTSAEECDCGRVCFGPLMTIADARELISTVETWGADLATLKAHTTDVTEELHRQLDAAEREAAAMRDRADSLAEDNADLEAKLKTAADAHPSCGLLDDCASECRCAEREQNLMARAEKAEAEVVGLRRGSPSLLQTVATAEHERDEARREAAALHDASEVRYARLRIANAHLSRLAAGLALRLALKHSTDDFVPRELLMKVAEATKAACVAACFALPDTATIGDADYAVSDVDLDAIVAEVKP